MHVSVKELCGFQAFFRRMTARCFVEAFATGNFSSAQTGHLTDTVEALLKARPLPRDEPLGRSPSFASFTCAAAQCSVSDHERGRPDIVPGKHMSSSAHGRQALLEMAFTMLV
jgi:hypothetical protein